MNEQLQFLREIVTRLERAEIAGLRTREPGLSGRALFVHFYRGDFSPEQLDALGEELTDG